MLLQNGKKNDPCCISSALISRYFHLSLLPRDLVYDWSLFSFFPPLNISKCQNRGSVKIILTVGGAIGVAIQRGKEGPGRGTTQQVKSAACDGSRANTVARSLVRTGCVIQNNCFGGTNKALKGWVNL